MSPRPDYDDSIASALPCELRPDVDGTDTVTCDSNLHTISTG